MIRTNQKIQIENGATRIPLAPALGAFNETLASKKPPFATLSDRRRPPVRPSSDRILSYLSFQLMGSCNQAALDGFLPYGQRKPYIMFRRNQFPQQLSVLCCAVLCCAVLCCAVLNCDVLYCAVLCFAVQCIAVL